MDCNTLVIHALFRFEELAQAILSRYVPLRRQCDFLINNLTSDLYRFPPVRVSLQPIFVSLQPVSTPQEASPASSRLAG